MLGPDEPHVAEVVDLPTIPHEPQREGVCGWSRPAPEGLPAPAAPDVPDEAEREMEHLPPPSYRSLLLDLPPPYPQAFQPAMAGFGQQEAPPSYSEVLFAHNRPQHLSVPGRPIPSAPPAGPRVQLPYLQTPTVLRTRF
ncbi:amyloid beta A4 precursor protein-binding family B member 1-interacting protein-like [Alosa sapidissima]|uniref:amyloid beta A4 precursor protein-binding family B member 1-interacting protein-like n=1 Tax=Alosa sapidissima TaxID=34773 RepID=UPI001C08CD02|nr:amyloid beta A4 precursor protein-binding family B member 1-interacting protein-like [Alosa sapidissima]